ESPRASLKASLLPVLAALVLSPPGCCQSASTGAIAGVALDPTGAPVSGIVIQLVNRSTGATATTTSDRQGLFAFTSLSPDRYELRVIQSNSSGFIGREIGNVSVTETLHLDFHLHLATVRQSISVSAEPQMVQADTAALGRVVNQTAVAG